MNGAVPMKMILISSGPSFSVRGNQFDALFNPGVGLIPSNMRPSRQRPSGVAFLSREIEIRREVAVPVDALDPPEVLADVHELLVEVSARQLGAAEALLPVVQGVNSFDELQETAELAEYEAANGFGSRGCLDVQAMLDDLADKEDAFTDTPWIPDQLGLAVQGALGCGDVEKV